MSRDIGIHSLDDVLHLSERPAAVNVKPARLGSLAQLLRLYDGCAHAGIALFHLDAPNDVAPSGYNEPEPPPGLPGSPLSVSARAGFR